MIDNLRPELVQRSDLVHLFLTQFKVPDPEIIFNAFFVNRLGQNNDAALYVSVQNDLTSRLMMHLSDLFKNGIRENSKSAFRERIPGFGLHMQLFHQHKCLRLLEEWMQFNLIDHRSDRNAPYKILQPGRVQVGNTDGAAFSSGTLLPSPGRY